MGRPSIGAWTVYECLRIELSYLLEHRYLVKGEKRGGIVGWTNQHGKDAGTIGIECSYLNGYDEKYIRLTYTATDKGGQKTDYNYKIMLVEVDSNLGRGKVLYFACPNTNRKCRILYKADTSEIFKSRDGYNDRLYYDCQHSSKVDKYNNNYWRLDKHLNKIEKTTKRGRRTYDGLLTKKACRYSRLHLKQWKMDELRWTLGVPKCLRGQML
jgi:hypothetical protein